MRTAGALGASSASSASSGPTRSERNGMNRSQIWRRKHLGTGTGTGTWSALALAIGGVWCGASTPAQAQAFKILSLSENNPIVVERDPEGGDDRGGIGLSPTQVFNTGDDATVRAARDLSSVTSVGTRYDGLVTELGSETLYTFITSDGAYQNDGDDEVVALERIDGETGALTGERITLSQPFDSDVGGIRRLVCAGLGRVVVYNGAEVFDIAIPSGEVTSRGTIEISNIYSSENWASWGVAEFFDGQLHLAYRANNGNDNDRAPVPVQGDLIQRVRVSDGVLSTVATISDLGDMASFVVSPRTGRWFFHTEGESFASRDEDFSETLVAADAVTGTIVTNVNDSGPGSLRAAIESTNAAGVGTILFDLPDSASTIDLQSPLPSLGANIIIDASTSSSNRIIINGAGAGANANGLVLTGNNRIISLGLRNFSGRGVVVPSGTGNTLDRVELLNNGQSIDLNADGPSLNDDLDEDGGANGTLNAPTLQSASTSGEVVALSGFYQGRPLATFRLQFFASPEATTSGSAQAAAFLLETNVTTDVRGRAAISLSLPTQAVGTAITATATDAGNSTSELSNAVAVDAGTVTLDTPDDSGVVDESLPSSVPISVRRNGGLGGTISVDYKVTAGTATANADFTPISGTLTLAPGEDFKSLAIPLVNDNIDEEDETIIVTLSNPSNGAALGRSTFTLIIRDDDGTPTLSLADLSLVEGTSGAMLAKLSNPSSRPVSFNYTTQPNSATDPADFSAQSAKLTFAPGETSLSIPVEARADALSEGDETFVVRASDVTNATLADAASAATVTIRDANSIPALSLSDVTITEGDKGASSGIITATLSQPSSRALSFDFATQNGTAVAPADYTARVGRITFEPGQLLQTIEVSVADDVLIEKDEAFTVLATSTDTGVATVARQSTVTIREDNDTRPSTSPTPPISGRQLTLLSPSNGAAYHVLPSVLGTYNGSIEVPVTVAIRNAQGRFWNGRAFAPTRTELPAARTKGQFVLLPQFAPPSSSLSEGPLQFIATAKAGSRSARATSRVLIDRTAPRVAFTTPTANATLSALTTITGTATDIRPATLSSGVARVLIAIRRGSDGAYWNGRTFGRAFFAAEAQLSGARWTISRNLPTGANLRTGSYTITAIAGDRAGNRGHATRSLTVASRPGA